MSKEDLLKFGRRHGLLSHRKKRVTEKESTAIEKVEINGHYEHAQLWSVAAAAYVFNLRIDIIGYKRQAIRTFTSGAGQVRPKGRGPFRAY